MNAPDRARRRDSPLAVSAEVADAVAAGRPVVALESTLIAHGLPRPGNLEVARQLEAELRARGVVPATVAVVDGQASVGLDDDQLTRIATGQDVAKLGPRELGLAIARRDLGATTVAGTAYLADLAGVRVFATGGLGGVHREVGTTGDESADLATLSAVPITVVAAGVKSILDAARTLERLESLSVTVAGYQTADFPGFYLTSSGLPLDWVLDSPAEVADVMAARDALGQRSALLLANPVRPEQQLDPELHDRVLTDALRALQAGGISGKQVTPFLLAYFHEHTGGESLRVNIDVVRGNVAVAAAVALAWSERARGGDRTG